MIGDVTVLFRLLVAAACGVAVGLPAELGHRPGGIRTHALAAMGAALFCLSALRLAGDKPTDAIHAIQGIASGVGFIGAAAVLRNAGTVRGLANAASIWIVAAIGCFAAIGDWDIAGLAALVALVANWFAVRAEKRLHTRQDGREELP
ncbi:MAG TPA: MgtC/SapB family protein [Polyangiaceae bacterium]|nr:MgtC/SapB family protein [Polyangiaceae bacterium]